MISSNEKSQKQLNKVPILKECKPQTYNEAKPRDDFNELLNDFI